MLALLLSPLASAQRGAAPTFGLQAPSSCTGADPGYTCTSTAQVTNYSPTTCGLNCHYEYCFAKSLNGAYANCDYWFDYEVPASITLGNNLTDGTITIYSEYRPVTYGVTGYPSQYGTASIILINTAPTVKLNSPAGILNAVGTLLQGQLINGAVGQYVTYQAASTGAGTVSVSFEPCILNSSCGSSVDLPQTQFIDPPAPATYTLPSVWSGWTPGTSTAYNYTQLAATDEASNTATTSTPSSAPFTLFNGDTTNASVSCTQSTCTYLADGTGENNGAGDMPGDPPSQPDANGNIYKGYADPTMRADTLVTSYNPNGTNLWLGYSWPLIQAYPDGSTVGTTEIHLAHSNTLYGANGGAFWSVWCSAGGDCPGPTPIYPSVMHGTGSTNYPYHFSSHEVLNLWPYIVQPSSANSYVGTKTWYAAHLMYFRFEGVTHTLPFDIQNYGCLVVATTNTSQSGQDSPGQLAWSTSTDPSSCLVNTLPSNSVFFDWGTLNSLSGQSCASWGQPAIMVSADGSTVYLAASCFSSSFESTGYWIFYASTSGMLTKSNWYLFNESFKYTDLPSLLQYYLGSSYTYLTEFDWAIRADNTIVAVVTPAGTGTQGQFGCVVLNFTLGSGTTQPFGSFWATVTDSDTSGPNSTSETNGPNGCTYEPRSNNGVAIVRNLMNSSSPTIETYSIVNTGLIP